MITENLNQVFRNYIDKFDYMNDKDHNESYKWIAVEHFQRNWDIDALDFISMFKEAVSKTDNLINNSKIHPSAGILKLADMMKKQSANYFEIFTKMIRETSLSVKTK